MNRRTTGKDMDVLIDGHHAPFVDFEYTLAPETDEEMTLGVGGPAAKGTHRTHGVSQWDVLEAVADNDYVTIEVRFPDQKVVFEYVEATAKREFPPDGMIETVIEWEAAERRREDYADEEDEVVSGLPAVVSDFVKLAYD